jgi:hypothetical protein
MNKRKFLLILMLSLGLVLAACSKDEPTNENPPVEEKPNQEELDRLERERLIEERRVLEEERKTALGEFYVPLPDLDDPVEPYTVKAKALYMTSNVAGFNFNEEDIQYYANYILALSGQSGQPVDESRLEDVNKLEKILGIIEATEVNSVVIDVKNDIGLVAWKSDIEIVNTVGSNWNTPMKNFNVLMDYLKSKEVYTIARIVAFKDPYFAENKPDHSIQLSAGGVYKDKAGFAWVNPFDEYVWKYVVAISQEAALRGFDEIQYDYIRFPDNAKYYNEITTFPGRNGRDKDEAIEDFLIFAQKALEPYHVHVSADVFGVITHSWDDKPEDIGQTWRKITNNTEYISPMVYPSHYGTGYYGFDVPDQHPYEIIQYASREAIERNAAQRKPAIIRHWYQGFTAPWVKGYILYEEDAIQKQIIAGVELGLDEYIIWNSGNTYYPLSFFYHDKVNMDLRQPGFDILGRSAEVAVTRYLDAQRFKRTNHLYLLTPIDLRAEDYDDFVIDYQTKGIQLVNYTIQSVEAQADGSSIATVKVNYQTETQEALMEDAKFKIVLENDVYKIVQAELSFTDKTN